MMIPQKLKDMETLQIKLLDAVFPCDRFRLQNHNFKVYEIMKGKKYNYSIDA